MLKLIAELKPGLNQIYLRLVSVVTSQSILVSVKFALFELNELNGLKTFNPINEFISAN